MAGFLQLWWLFASIIPWFLIDRIGRRPLVSQTLHLLTDSCKIERQKVLLTDRSSFL